MFCLTSLCRRPTGKQRNGIWSQNEDCGCHPFLYRNLWSFQWARKRAHQSGDCPVCWFGGRSTGSSVCSVRSVWPSTAQRDPQRLEGYCASFFSVPPIGDPSAKRSSCSCKTQNKNLRRRG